MKFEEYYKTTGVCTDTRNILKDCLFICLTGENFNGNDYAVEALKKGAKYVISDDSRNEKINDIFIVYDSLKYLQELANYHRNKFNIPILGITGSNGKTTSKELIYQVLKQKYSVHATVGNLNNHIGVPLTLLQLSNHHEIAIIEMGANKPGDIQELVDIAEPTHCIITNIGKAHLEGFGSYAGVIKTKGEMYQYAANKEAIIFYNDADEVLKSILPKNTQTIPYSYNLDCRLVKMTPYVSMSWKSNNYSSRILETQMIGKYNYLNFIAAISIGKFFQVDNDKISLAITNYTPTNNRSQVQKTENNTLIMDAYNANPSSMKNAIDSFDEMEHPNKLLILGDMFELGEESKIEHQEIIENITKRNLSCYFVGTLFNSEKQHLDNCLFFESKIALIENLKSNSIENKLILLKASRGIGLEEIVKYL
jgi:UDP-N-acetylmuramoyl-tripeptide--D-alanyl-D-alanine ligase